MIDEDVTEDERDLRTIEGSYLGRALTPQHFAHRTASLIHVFCVNCGYLDTFVDALGVSLPKQRKHNCNDTRIQRQ